MKTKLLKKVRERYSIDVLTEIDKTMVNSIYYGYTLPLYVLHEDGDYRFANSDYNQVYEFLLYCIRDRYSYTKKNYRNKFKKIWWKKSN